MSWLTKILKIIGWTLVGVILLFAGILAGTISVLTPERLTPLIEKLANNSLKADVSLAKAELTLQKTWPFLCVNVDSLVVVSRDIAEMKPEARDTLPVWADTLASIDKIRGGVNVHQLALGRVSLNNLEIVGPQINLLVVNDTLSNFSIAKNPQPIEPEDTVVSNVPDIRIQSFRLIKPRLLRYSDASTGMYAQVTIDSAYITDAHASGHIPSYRLKVDTNIESPILDAIGRNDVEAAVDGVLDWQHENPLVLKFKDFSFAVGELSGMFNTEIFLSQQLRVNSLDFELNPLSVTRVLDYIGESAKQRIGIPDDIVTNAEISLSGRLTAPLIASEDTIPHMGIDISIPDCWLRWKDVDIHRLELDAFVNLQGNNPNAAEVIVRKFMVADPSTRLDVKGKVSNMAEDALFNCTVDGEANAGKFPPILASLFNGAVVGGTLELNAEMKARKSMFTASDFHKIRLNGEAVVNNLYYLAPDTQKFVNVKKATLRFGANKETRLVNNQLVDSMLAASLSVDTAQFLVSGIKMGVGNLSLGFGTTATAQKADDAFLPPLGGRLRVGSFSLLSLSDTARAKVKNLEGKIAFHRRNAKSFLPIFTLNTSIASIDAGSKTTDFVVSGVNLGVKMSKKAGLPRSASSSSASKKAKSHAISHHEIPADSVYAIALEIRRRNSTGHHRVHTELEDGTEYLEWGATQVLQSLLVDWNVTGRFFSNNSRLLASAFPIHNRLTNLNISFNNDSASLNNICWQIGRSNLVLKGNITNIADALISDTKEPLKVNLAIASDTIDVNEISRALFSGADARKTQARRPSISASDFEKMLDDEFRGEKRAALLIPVNIDARLTVEANNIFYSDFLLHNLNGTILAYDGALSLHELSATSDVGKVNLSALYSAPAPSRIKFGFGLDLCKFNINEFLGMVPAVDSIVPMLHDLGGIITAQIAATADVDSNMNLELPTLNAMISISGDSLVVLNEKTYKTIAKWLLFKDKNRNIINHVNVNIAVKDDMLQIYPFIFDFDRYKLGIYGHNDLQMKFNYHVAVLKSPLPFKFGVNIEGTPKDYKIRLGGAHFKQGEVAASVNLADTIRINLVRQFQDVFRRGLNRSDFAKINIGSVPALPKIDFDEFESLSPSDSLYLMNEGLLPNPSIPDASQR